MEGGAKGARAARMSDILRLLQSGNFSHVYQLVGWEGCDEEELALEDVAAVAKVYRDDVADAAEHAENEIRALERLQENGENHNCVIRLLFVDRTGANLPIVGLEHCQGGDMYELLQHGPLDEADVKYYAAELASALEYLRQNQVFHGDVKPENLGLSANGHLRLLDFGSSRVLEAGSLVIHASGSLYYASPEAYKRSPCSYAIDWWGMGAVLYEMLFGQQVFSKESVESTMHHIINAIIIWPTSPSCTITFQSFVSQFLKREPEERLQSLQACLSHPFMDEVNYDQVKHQSWVPLRFTMVNSNNTETIVEDISSTISSRSSESRTRSTVCSL